MIAAVLRLAYVDLAPLAYDEIDVLYRARDVAAGQLTATGPLTSWGIPDPPVSVYLMVPPAFTPWPAAASTAWAAVLNVAAIGVTYVAVRRSLGASAALVTIALLGTNAWAVYFSRRTWAEIAPLFTAVALWAALEVVCRGRAAWAVAFFVALMLQAQTRILAAIYVPAAGLSVLMAPRAWGWRWPLLGCVLAGFVASPYLGFVAIHWAELTSRLAEGNRGIALTPKASALDLILSMASGYSLLPEGSRAAPWLPALAEASRAAFWVAGALLLAGVAMCVAAAVRRGGSWRAALLVAAWLVLPVGMLVLQSSSIYLHYMVGLIPSLFVVMGLPLAWALAHRWLAARALAAAVLAAYVGLQVALVLGLYQLVAMFDSADTSPVERRQAVAAIPREAAEQLGTGERYGVEIPIRFWQQLADGALAEAARLGFSEIYVLAGETDPLLAERPAVLDFLLRTGVTPRFLLTDTLVLPLHRPSLVLEAPDLDAPEQMRTFGPQLITLGIPSVSRTGRDNARLTLVQARDEAGWAKLAPNALEADWSGGVHLLGVRAARQYRPGEEIPVVTYWRLDADAPAVPPLMTVRAVDSSGRRVAETAPDRPSPPTPAGPRGIVKRHLVALPPRLVEGEYRLELSLTSHDGTLLAVGGAESLTLAGFRVAGR